MAEPLDGGVREAWARAFLRQGKSDLDTFLFLSALASAQIPTCHRLHFLQMACEKIAKAYRIRDTAAPLEGENGLLTRRNAEAPSTEPLHPQRRRVKWPSGETLERAFLVTDGARFNGVRQICQFPRRAIAGRCNDIWFV